MASRTTLARPLAAGAVAALGTVLALASPSQADAARATCHGFPVTTTKSSGLIIGTAKRDVIRLTGPGHVRSGGGADIICGSRFADVIESGAGDDVVLAGRGHDRVRGGAGRDRLFGEGGNDILHGGAGGDVMHGGAGRNRILGVTRTRSREHFTPAPSWDRVVQGTHAVSIVSDPQSVQAMWATGGTFVASWVPTPTSVGWVPVAWQVAPPYVVTTVGVGTEAAVFWAEGDPLVPGVSIQPAQSISAEWGEQFSVLGPGGMGPGTPGSPPGTIGVTNLGNQAITAGTMMLGSVNGAPSSGIASAAPLYPQMLGVFPRPTNLRIDASDIPVRAGDVLSPAPVGPSVTVGFSADQPTAALRYSASGGFTLG